MKAFRLLLTIILLSLFSVANAQKKVIVAYITSWTRVIPDPNYVTHLNYAFGHVNDNFNGIKIDNEPRLKEIVALKRQFPMLKVMLSIGGWTSGKFSEMAATADNRNNFAEDCLRVIKEFKLDGIDIDWEYPTSTEAKISASPDDTKNYTLLMQGIRKKIGKKQLLTLASIADAIYIDYKAINPIVDFVNIMPYDTGLPTFHHAGLYRSKNTSRISVEEAVLAHVRAGIPINKLVMGIPFYGHGKSGVPGYIDYKDIIKLTGYKEMWDDVAKAPYWENDKGEFVLTYETPRSIKEKCNYILNKGMLGAMYWDYAADTQDGVLRKAVHSGVKN
ncbi:MAG: glycoside hydrolase family 18 protein [Pedobacter sp.]|nr:MAG: glycoside hydrolase family 18 protein [Pedobacter sp.]